MTERHPSSLESLGRFDRAVPALVDSLRELDAVHAEYVERGTTARVLPNVVEALRIELTYHSNALEGNTLTLRETQMVIEGLTPGGNRPLREVYEARNHDRALRLVEKWAADRPDADLTADDVLAVHAQVMADIDLDSAGQFRRDRVLIAGTGFVPPGSHKFHALITAMLALANRQGVHPALQAAELHYNLVAIHPFNDGNGRTARLMMNHHLLRHGFPHAIIRVTERGEYLSALDEANHGRIEPFARFVIHSLMRSTEQIIGS